MYIVDHGVRYVNVNLPINVFFLLFVSIFDINVELQFLYFPKTDLDMNVSPLMALSAKILLYFY